MSLARKRPQPASTMSSLKPRRPRCFAVALRLRREAATYTSGVRTRGRESGGGGSGRRRVTINCRAGEVEGSTHVGTDALWRADLVTWAISGIRRGKGERSPTRVAVGVLGEVPQGRSRRVEPSSRG